MAARRPAARLAGCIVLLAACSCHTAPPRAPAIGEVFAGPSALNLRKELSLQSATVAVVKHGERLEVLQRHRTFFRVRAPNGAEGWADQRQLLGAADMRNLTRLARAAAKMPSQGAATPRFGDLRIYTQPSRESPGFITIKEKEKVDVLGQALVPREHIARSPLLPPAPKKLPPRKKAKESAIPPVPPPKPPAPPADWQALSKTEAGEEDETPAAPPAPEEEWSLVRTPAGEARWTLTRRIEMAIPDEVAQYAEGRRIVAYFALGSVRDGDENKNIWLWTTVADGAHPYDFDSFRVFIWSLRRHRYETSYIERNLIGFEPVTLETVSYAGAQYPGFSICLRKKDGGRYRREYALLTNVVRFAGERPCENGDVIQDLIAASAKPSDSPAATAMPAAPPRPPLSERVKRQVRGWFRK